MRILLTSTFILLFGISIGYAQTYSPDRPGIGNGSSITPKKMLAVETGIELTTNDFINQYDIGQLLLRYGITEKLEIRAALNSYTYIDYVDYSISQNGFNDMGIGAKYQFIEGTSNHPSLSAMVELSLPVGSDEFTNDDITSTLGILSDYDLNNMWSVSSNLYYWFNPEYSNADYWVFTFTPGFTIPGNENIAGYFGYAGYYYDGGNYSDWDSINWLEAGVTYSLEGNGQIDINFGYESDLETFFIGAGFAKGFN